MYAPSSGEPEWIELFNPKFFRIEFEEMENLDLTTNVVITANDKFIQPGGFIVITNIF